MTDGWTGANPYPENEPRNELTPQSADDLRRMIEIARALISGKRLRNPVEVQILALARTVVELADHGMPK